MGNIISMKDYKRQHGIALPRSPYYTLDATPEQIQAALELAAEEMEKPCDYRGLPPYAVVVGYKNMKTGKIKLLKGVKKKKKKKALESLGGIGKGYSLVGLQQKSADGE